MVPLSHRVASGQCARGMTTGTDNPPIPRRIKAVGVLHPDVENAPSRSMQE